MWWYGYGWWWWWFAFIVLFFLLPLGYGWGYRGWGPWYQRSGRLPRERRIDASQLEPITDQTGWGWAGMVLWIVAHRGDHLADRGLGLAILTTPRARQA